MHQCLYGWPLLYLNRIEAGAAVLSTLTGAATGSDAASLVVVVHLILHFSGKLLVPVAARDTSVEATEGSILRRFVRGLVVGLLKAGRSVAAASVVGAVSSTLTGAATGLDAASLVVVVHLILHFLGKLLVPVASNEGYFCRSNRRIDLAAFRKGACSGTAQSG